LDTRARVMQPPLGATLNWRAILNDNAFEFGAQDRLKTHCPAGIFKPSARTVVSSSLAFDSRFVTTPKLPE